jgi:hypothetical protein
LWLETNFYEILVTAYYDKSLPMVPRFCPSGFRAGVSKNQARYLKNLSVKKNASV